MIFFIYHLNHTSFNFRVVDHNQVAYLELDIEILGHCLDFVHHNVENMVEEDNHLVDLDMDVFVEDNSVVVEYNHLVIEYNQNIVEDNHLDVENNFLVGYIVDNHHEVGMVLMEDMILVLHILVDHQYFLHFFYILNIGGLLSTRSTSLADSFGLLGSFAGVPCGIVG